MSVVFSAFQNGNYRVYWSASLLYQICRFSQITLLSYLVLDLTDSASLVALVGFFAMVPVLFLGLLAGVLADTVNRRTLLLYTHLVAFIAVFTMTLLLWLEYVLYWHAYLIILIGGVGNALDMPSKRSLIHDILSRSGVTNGLALDSAGMSVSGIIGPVLAGGLIAIAGVGGGYIAVAILLLTALVLVYKLNFEQSERKVNNHTGMVTNIVIGLKFVLANPGLRTLILITVIMNMMLFPYIPLVPVIARDVLNVGPGLMGVLQSAAGVGMFLGALTVAAAGNVRYHGRVFIIGSTVALISLFLFSLSHSYFLSAIFLLLLGFGMSLFGTMQAAIVILLSNLEVRGRALGVVSLAIGTMPIGSLIIAGMASIYGPTFAFGLNAAIGVVILGLITFTMPALRGKIVS